VGAFGKTIAAIFPAIVVAVSAMSATGGAIAGRPIVIRFVDDRTIDNTKVPL